MASETLFPIPGTYQDRPLVSWFSSRRGDCDHWPDIQAWAATFFGCRADEVNSREVFWGGSYNDDDMREVLTVKGQIVAVFDHPLTPGQWLELLAADAAERAPASPLLAAE